jgi:hypothetical protein
MGEKILRIPIRLTASIADGYLTLQVHESVLTVSVADIAAAEQRLRLEPGKTLFDLVLDAAKTVVQGDGAMEFTAAELYGAAHHRHPELRLRRNTWGAHIIASAPAHRSYRYHTSRRDYFEYLGSGRYRLNSRYIAPQSDR